MEMSAMSAKLVMREEKDAPPRPGLPYEDMLRCQSIMTRGEDELCAGGLEERWLRVKTKAAR